MREWANHEGKRARNDRNKKKKINMKDACLGEPSPLCTWTASRRRSCWRPEESDGWRWNLSWRGSPTRPWSRLRWPAGPPCPVREGGGEEITPYSKTAVFRSQTEVKGVFTSLQCCKLQARVLVGINHYQGRGDVGSEKYAYNLLVFIWRQGVSDFVSSLA